MSKRTRRRYTPEQKAALVRQHVVDKKPVSESREQELEAKIAALEVKLARKDAIIAEVSEEYVKLKKALGEP